jgi:hypothetical protein
VPSYPRMANGAPSSAMAATAERACAGTCQGRAKRGREGERGSSGAEKLQESVHELN